MKKKIAIVLALLIAGTGVAFGAQNIYVDPNTVTITVNGKTITTDNFLYNGTTYVPLRAVSEELDAQVGWNQATKTASITMPSSSLVSTAVNDLDIMYVAKNMTQYETWLQIELERFITVTLYDSPSSRKSAASDCVNFLDSAILSLENQASSFIGKEFTITLAYSDALDAYKEIRSLMQNYINANCSPSAAIDLLNGVDGYYEESIDRVKTLDTAFSAAYDRLHGSFYK